jgi:hypothetical protein
MDGRKFRWANSANSLTARRSSPVIGPKPACRSFKKGQIVYEYLRPYLNKVWIAEFDGCSSVDQFAFDVNGDVADVSFVSAFMRSDTFLRRSAVVPTTGQLPRISIDEILAVRIYIPPTVADQVRIASNLSARLNHAVTLAQDCESQIAYLTAMPASLLRGQKVLLASDLAELYGVETKVLNQAVRRNRTRFPDDFMFQLSAEEFTDLKSQFVTSSWGSRRTAPYAFTKQGVAIPAAVASGVVTDRSSC